MGNMSYERNLGKIELDLAEMSRWKKCQADGK